MRHKPAVTCARRARGGGHNKNPTLDRGYLRHCCQVFLALALFGLAFVANARAQSLPSVNVVPAGALQPLLSADIPKCSDIDVPDAGLRAFVAKDGSLVAYAAHYNNLRMRGPNWQHLAKDCRQSYVSGHQHDPSAHDDQTWIAATWTDDGVNIAAIGHNEYHGELHSGMCHGSTPRECRYGVLTHLLSHDGGRTYLRTTKRPIAAVPKRQSKDQNRDVGFFLPSNIIAHQDYKYVFVRTSGGGRQSPATCIMRARAPATASSWEIHDGTRFRPALFDPYVDPIDARPICAQIPGLTGLVWSVLRHEVRGIFVALLTIIEPQTGKTLLATATSRDLLVWTRPFVIHNPAVNWEADCTGKPMLHYPSLLDPASRQRNFDTIGDSAWLFLVRIQRRACKLTLERELVFLPVSLEFSDKP